MSVEYNAHVVYGVPADLAMVCDFRDNNESEWEEIYDDWVINPDLMRGSDQFIIGFYIEYVNEGEFVEFDPFIEPPEEDINKLRKVLEYLGIKEKPRWFLMCRVS